MMTNPEDLLMLVENILKLAGEDGADLESWSQTADGQKVIQYVVQIGKYNTNLGESSDISIGDQLNRELLEEIRDLLRSQVHQKPLTLRAIWWKLGILITIGGFGLFLLLPKHMSTKTQKSLIVGDDGQNIHQPFVRAFGRNGGATVLGQPSNSLKTWSIDSRSGKIQAFIGGLEDEGSLILSSTGDEAYWVGGSFWRTFQAANATQGILAYPISDRYSTKGGLRQDFSGGAILKSSSGTFAVWGGIGGHYLQIEQGEKGRLGFPIEGELGIGSGIHIQRFQNGCIRYYENGTKTHSVFHPKLC
jgi:Effector-associated domain 10/LGFP repeat